jgi:hypothetical protein
MDNGCIAYGYKNLSEQNVDPPYQVNKAVLHRYNNQGLLMDSLNFPNASSSWGTVISNSKGTYYGILGLDSLTYLAEFDANVQLIDTIQIPGLTNTFLNNSYTQFPNAITELPNGKILVSTVGGFLGKDSLNISPDAEIPNWTIDRLTHVNLTMLDSELNIIWIKIILNQSIGFIEPITFRLDYAEGICALRTSIITEFGYYLTSEYRMNFNGDSVDWVVTNNPIANLHRFQEGFLSIGGNKILYLADDFTYLNV